MGTRRGRSTLATSKCSECKSTRFEAAKARVKDSSIPYVFVQCASCGSVVGVSEAPHILRVLSQIAGKFGIKLRT